MSNKDFFSVQAKNYAKFRPRYPLIIFEFLNDLVSEHNNAWDCATGNGQVALSLTSYFKNVYASDLSENQIKHAFTHSKIKYFVSSVESTYLPDKSIDLITVSQALHWFDIKKFYQEAHRVLKPNGVIAIWGYNFFYLKNQLHLKPYIDRYYEEIKPFWASETKLLHQEYRTISFPFQEIKSPQFVLKKKWSVQEMIGYLSTFSALQIYLKAKSKDVIAQIFQDIFNSISSAETIEVEWNLCFRLGKI